MASKASAGANTPAALTVEGHEIAVDKSALGKWSTFAHVRAIADPDLDDFAKIGEAFAFAQDVCGLTEADIVEMCGGKDATTEGVMGFVGAVIAAAYPKN